jgi:hypothetical protein
MDALMAINIFYNNELYVFTGTTECFGKIYNIHKETPKIERMTYFFLRSNYCL